MIPRRIDIDCGDPFELLVGERLSCDIGEMLGEVTQSTLGINNGRLFATGNHRNALTSWPIS